MDSVCPRCHGSQESIVHVFFECPFANIIWRHLSHPLNIDNIPPRLAPEWIELILNPSTHLGLNPQDAHAFTLLAAIACDRIWWSRNKLVFDSSPPASPIDVTADINRSFSAYSNAWKLKMQPTISAWEPPPPGWVKFNFDVAITLSASFPSAIFRDSNRHFISIFTAKESISSLAWAKAKAALLAVSSAANLQLPSIIFEGDAKIVIDSIKAPSSTPFWDLRLIISNIQLLLPYFSQVVFNFCHRASNGLTHSIAFWASFCSTWGPQPISSIPSWVLCEDSDGQVPPLLSLPSVGLPDQ
ncbi:uncharacterized protein LOC142607649 [Castanea sativa]|uniref:uncharacterized protein LOC142607649 n=1 Tax=Castanea sativa TaxID=21020 RepID=UPI003F64B44B